MTSKRLLIFCFLAQVVFLNCQDTVALTKNIAIFIDHGHEFSESAPGALTKALMVALSEQAYPIVASFDLWHSFMKHQSGLRPVMEQLPHLPFNENDWTVKQVDAYLIFLPKKIFSAQETALVDGPLTADEKKSGLKTAHMQTYMVTVDQQTKEAAREHADKKEVPLEDTFKKIFVIKRDVTPGDLTILPHWNLFFMGHGLPGKTIVDLSVDSFKKILDFCAYSITTDYFMYLSCFAGGVNKINGFTQQENNTLRASTYPYTIISFSSAEQTTTLRFSDVDCAPRFLPLFTALENKKEPLDFFAMAKDARMLGYCKTEPAYILGSVTRVYSNEYEAYVTQGTSSDKTGMLPKNIPQVRLPGREFFSVEPVFGTKKNPDIMLISNITSKTLPLDKVIRVPATTQGIFLNTHAIPQDIELMSPTVYIPQLVPLEIESSYFFRSISATHLSLYEFLRMFGLFPPSVRINIGTLILKNTDLKNREVTQALNYPHDGTLFFSDVFITTLPSNIDENTTRRIVLMADMLSPSGPRILEVSLTLSHGDEQRGSPEIAIHRCDGISAAACIEARVKDSMNQNYRVFDHELSARGNARTLHTNVL